jgi:hypothetical protein
MSQFADMKIHAFGRSHAFEFFNIYRIYRHGEISFSQQRFSSIALLAEFCTREVKTDRGSKMEDSRE